MIIDYASVKSVDRISESVYAINFTSPHIAETTGPGQFVNIKVTSGSIPLLRRPFSVAYIEGETVTVIFNIIGEGTKILSEKKPGEILNVMGPLGKGFSYPNNEKSVCIVAGGLGIAPFPLLTQKLTDLGISDITTYYGMRNASYYIDYHLSNIKVATDDGSLGYHGTVVSLFLNSLDLKVRNNIAVYACGPNQMLKSLQESLKKYGLDCEVSLECVMACGFGICQGCPVEVVEGDRKFHLVCKDGPVFNLKKIMIK